MTCTEPLVLNFLKKFFIQSYGDDFFYLRLIFVDVLPFVLSFCISSLNVTLSPRYCILQDWFPPPPPSPEVSDNHQQTANSKPLVTIYLTLNLEYSTLT